MAEKTKTIADVVEEYFESHPEFFPTSAEKAVFLLGILTDALLDAQRKEQDLKNKSEAPFRKHLKGLRLQYRDLEKLFPVICDKLAIWSKNYDYPDLKKAFTRHMAATPVPFPLSSNKISFIFAMGLHSGLLYESRSENNADAHCNTTGG